MANIDQLNQHMTSPTAANFVPPARYPLSSELHKCLVIRQQ